MKKVLITMAVLLSLVTDGMVSSFAAPKQKTKEECFQIVANVPKKIILYEGWADAISDLAYPQKIYVQVYKYKGSAIDKKWVNIWLDYRNNTYYDWQGCYEIFWEVQGRDGTFYSVRFNDNTYNTR